MPLTGAGCAATHSSAASWQPVRAVRLRRRWNAIAGSPLASSIFAALNMAGVTEQLTYVSTAGGAFLEWMEGKALPGVEALQLGDRLGRDRRDSRVLDARVARPRPGVA